jgi:hypothetical protein
MLRRPWDEMLFYTGQLKRAHTELERLYKEVRPELDRYSNRVVHDSRHLAPSVPGESCRTRNPEFVPVTPTIREVLGRASRVLLAPDQRLPDDFVLIRACEMPQKSLANFLVNEHGECTALRMPPSMQLDRKMALIDASLKRRRVPHFRKYYRRKQRNL